VTVAGGSATASFPATAGTISYSLAVTITATSTTNSTVSAGASVSLNPTAPTGTAAFTTLNTTTEGDWIGVYGSNGYNVIGNTASYPSYVTVTPSGESVYTWASSTSDVRALQEAGSTTNRIAATWFSSSSFAIDLAFNDTAQHQVAIYCLDWDSTSRAQTVNILDENNILLNSQNVTNFHNGQYLVWQLSGHVKIQVTRTAGANAVVSGLFFDNGVPVSVTGTAAFTTLNTTTEGNWIGVYGSNGYNVINDAVSYPSYVTVTPSGESAYTWASSTSDGRALEEVGSTTNRIAAAWYGSAFTIDLAFNDTAQHQVAIYCVDWDSTSRAETVNIVDENNVLLNTQSVSNFHNGQYLVWQLSGHVKIQVTTANPSSNSVISGLFFQ
jgi:hypothetical protein